ncbi:hypothetical protein BASA61_003874 [Batrachochytrium salamandrivorans]|nr:hypothetical protein BASA61_003874 [Batrachochytrium salamandrivorans]
MWSSSRSIGDCVTATHIFQAGISCVFSSFDPGLPQDSPTQVDCDPADVLMAPLLKCPTELHEKQYQRCNMRPVYSTVSSSFSPKAVQFYQGIALYEKRAMRKCILA